ncbi:MAG TPA: hypothetical protein VK515_06850 [Rhizomicrobium sp.]|nr:hypothetical protein [Rhizomicrobium sp.]
MRLPAAGFALVTVLSPALAESDIVWPGYDEVERSGDALLDCSQLHAQIDHVGSDVSLLRKAQVRVEDALRSAFDMERYGGSNGPGGQRISSGTVQGKESYAAAREAIVASLKNATARQSHLKSLEPACRPAPQHASVP